MSKNKENILMPKIRFPEFLDMHSWVVKSLGNVAEVYQPKTISQSELNDNGYLVYGANGIIGHYNNYNHETSQIAIACRGSSCGTVNFTEPKSWITGNAMVVNVDDFNEVHKKFMFYQLFAADLNYLITGSGQPQITGNIKNHRVVLTTLKEQQKIADCLTSLDEIIKAESQKLDFLYDYKKGLLQNLFPLEGETFPNIRFPEFKENWRKVKLRDVSQYFNGGSFENDVKEEGKYELITLKSINTNGQLVSSKRFVDIEVPTLAKGTLVMILSEQAPGLLGMTAIIPTANKYVLNQRVAEIRPSQEVDSYFLSMAINRNQAYFSKQGAGMKVQNISKPNVQNYEFLIPEIQEQKKIATCLSSLDEIISTQNLKLESLQYHKKGLLQSLFPNINKVKE